jgi:hypothetical protein
MESAKEESIPFEEVEMKMKQFQEFIDEDEEMPKKFGEWSE